ncbi:transposase [Amycolatopsis sp. NPDC004747]
MAGHQGGVDVQDQAGQVTSTGAGGGYTGPCLGSLQPGNLAGGGTGRAHGGECGRVDPGQQAPGSRGGCDQADAVVGADSRGFDGGKLVNGRKRHVVVDTLGLLLGVMVTSANVSDRAAAQVLLRQVADAHHLLKLVWADGGYTGSLVEYCLATFALVLAIVKRSDDMRGFVVLPKRWIVERLFAHLMRTRRLARDFERRTTSAEAMIYWSMTLLMTRRLARSPRGRA